MSTTVNLFRRFTEALPSTPPLLVGDVTFNFGDGTVNVTLPGGGVVRVRRPQSITATRVFVQGDAVTGEAPALPVEVIEI